MRYSKRRQPGDYMSAGNDSFVASEQALSPEDISAEFMLNALRLNDGFAVSQFQLRTGLPITKIQATVEMLSARQLLVIDGDRIRTTELGRRFLDSVVAEFFQT